MSKSPTGAPKRVAVGLLAGALSVFGIALAPNAGAISTAVFDRVAGTTRYGTAGAVSTEAYPDGSDCVIIATGVVFADSLAASGLAGSLDCPILLVQQDSITEETAASIEELGATTATIVGGTAAVSEDVEAALVADHGLTVDRIGGDDRYATAALIADAIDDGAVSEVAIVASGEVAADAQSAGPMAAELNAPILLAMTDEVPAVTSDALAGRGEVLVVGGTARISDETEADIVAASDDDAAERLAGLDRQETAAIIAEQYEVGTLGWDPTTVMLAAPNAPSDDFSPDALVAGPLGGLRQAPTLIVDDPSTLGEDAEAFIDAHSDSIAEVLCIGGTAVLTDELCSAAEAAAQNTGNDADTGGDTQTAALQGPELQSCAISGLELEELAISYTFTFDQELDADDTNPDLFKLYNAANNNAALGDVFNGGADMEIDGETAIVVFNLADYGVANATLCAAAEDAVTDQNGNGNPAQSVEAGGIGNAAGVGLVSAEIVDEDDGIVELEWGSPQAPGSGVGNLYELITKEGHVFRGTPADAAEAFGEASATNYPDDDELSTTVRVQFECDGDNLPAQYGDAATDADADTTNDPCSGAEDGDGADLSDENIRRIAAVSTTSGRIHTADISSGGTTDGPDLIGVEFASDNDALEDNQALFIFDEDIDTASTTPAAAGAYHLVYSHCSTTPAVLNTLLTAADTADGDVAYEDMEGQGFTDTIDAQGSCMLSGVSVDTGTAVDSDDFTEREIVVTFAAAADDLDNDFAIAGQVGDDAALASGDAGISDDDTPVVTNASDEVELNRQPSSIYADGEVEGPQLIGASVEVDTTFGGEFSAWVLTLTFDKDIDDAALGGAVRFFYDDGENVESDDLTCAVDDDTSVTCEITDEDSDFANAVVVSVEAGTVDTAGTFTLGDSDINVQLPNPEASIAIEVPPAPESA